MRLVHESDDGERRTLAGDVETADSVVSQVRGLMFRTSVPTDYALVFRIEPGYLERLHERLPSPVNLLTAGAPLRNVHMLFVRVPLDVIWIEDGEVLQVRTLPPWWGTGSARGDTLVEMAAGGAADVDVGDTVELVDDVDRRDGDVDRRDGDVESTDRNAPLATDGDGDFAASGDGALAADGEGGRDNHEGDVDDGDADESGQQSR